MKVSPCKITIKSLDTDPERLTAIYSLSNKPAWPPRDENNISNCTSSLSTHLSIVYVIEETTKLIVEGGQ